MIPFAISSLMTSIGLTSRVSANSLTVRVWGSSRDADSTAFSSARGCGGAFSGGDVSRAEEIANVRDFFDVARGIRIDRTTRPQDVKADALRAEARSSYRITYTIEGARMSRRYDATYRLARERGAWRIVEVTIQAEAP